ncbi:MAG: c-type cytochrome [Pseudomonadales bacterium]|nr:c-type cytochrome [Pseudomonadales bacterium]
MNKLVISLAASLALAALSSAVYAAGDAAAGERKVAVCAACHGSDGNSQTALYPKLAGQNEAYTFKQLQDIQSGARSVALMTGLLNSMSEQDLQDIAAFYASQEITLEGADPELVDTGASIYRAGIKDLGVAACTACHSPTGKGNAPAGFPAIGGQHADYLITQLKAFRSGERSNDGDTMPMRIVTERLTDKEIEALASFMSGLH